MRRGEYRIDVHPNSDGVLIRGIHLSAKGWLFFCDMYRLIRRLRWEKQDAVLEEAVKVVRAKVKQSKAAPSKRETKGGRTQKRSRHLHLV